MEIWIKDLTNRSCYTRFGKTIPKSETKIDMIKYFGRDVLSELKSDKNIKCIMHNAPNLEAEKKEAAKKEDVATKEKKINISQQSNETLKKMAKEKGLKLKDNISRKDLIKLVRDN
jgi:hypothetical protein